MREKKYDVNIYSVKSGLSSSGVDLGSGYVMPLNKPSALMLIGTGVRSYEAGKKTGKDQKKVRQHL